MSWTTVFAGTVLGPLIACFPIVLFFLQMPSAGLHGSIPASVGVFFFAYVYGAIPAFLASFLYALVELRIRQPGRRIVTAGFCGLLVMAGVAAMLPLSGGGSSFRLLVAGVILVGFFPGFACCALVEALRGERGEEPERPAPPVPIDHDLWR